MTRGYPLRLFFVAAVLVFLPFAWARRWAPDTITFFAYGAAAALVTGALVAALASSWLRREVRLLTEAATRIAAGEHGVRTRVSGDGGGDDEMERLGGALDRLAETLGAATNDLRTERDLVAGILDGMQEGVLLIQGDGSVGLVNTSLREMFLLSGDVVGRPLLMVLRHSVLLELVETVRRRKKAASGEIELGGLKPRRLLVRIAPLAKDLASQLVVVVDVTELRRLERVRQDFVANVSHELRTPVAAIQSAAETLGDGALGDAVAAPRFLDMIARNSARLRNLIDDLLDLSRIEANEFAVHVATTNLAAAVAQVFAGARAAADRQRVTLASEIAARGETAMTDPRAVEQILGNLVDNAVKYCPGALVTVTIVPRDGGGVSLRVADTGPGIEPRHIGRIFERFYRVDAGRSRDLGGTGLGLSIVKHLVDALGGTVHVESVVGRGTTFSVELPARSESGVMPSDGEPPAATGAP